MIAAPGAGAAVVHDATSGLWLALRDPVEVVTASNRDEVMPALERVERAVSRGQIAAGFVAYEAASAFDPALAVRPDEGFPLLWFGLYSGSETVTLPPPRPTARRRFHPTVSRRQYQAAVATVKQHIAAGDTYQVNLTFRLRGPAPRDPWAYFLAMAAAQDAAYCAFVDTGRFAICCASPELFFDLSQERLSSRPMKGTMPRCLTAREDLEQGDRLRSSEKNLAENLIIVDMVRNDLGRVAEPGSVRVAELFSVERYPTLWQLTSTIECSTRAGLVELFRALFPPASVTGAPKPRTMRLIAELESTPRRVYTGAVGFVAPGRRAQLSVAIRTLVVDRQTRMAEYGVGGGIVWDSDPADELDECWTKAKVLSRESRAFRLLESLLWAPEDGFFLLDRHLDRLHESAAYFGFTVDIAAVRARLAALASSLPTRPHKVRLEVDKGGSLSLSQEPLEPHREPVHLALSARPVDREDVFLYHKTTRRNVYERARRRHPEADDVVLWNAAREVTESTTANVVVELDGRLFTPPVRCGLLAGTYRALLLDQREVEERVILVDELPRCSGIFLANSVRKLRPATVTS